METVPKEYQDCCVKVMDYLYVGDKKAAKSKSLLERLGITDIINVTPPKKQGGIHNIFETDTRFTYFRCPCVDSDVEDLSPYFKPCIQFIDNARKKGHSVLVHCQLGQSRSVTVILAYMISLKPWDLKKAYTHLKTIRPKVKPKANFLRQLIHFENQQKLQQPPQSQPDQNTQPEHQEEEKAKQITSKVVVIPKQAENVDSESGGKESSETIQPEQQHTSDVKEKQKKKRILHTDTTELDSFQPPAKKKMKLSLNQQNVIGSQSRVFGVALPPHLLHQT